MAFAKDTWQMRVEALSSVLKESDRAILAALVTEKSVPGAAALLQLTEGRIRYRSFRALNLLSMVAEDSRFTLAFQEIESLVTAALARERFWFLHIPSYSV